MIFWYAKEYGQHTYNTVWVTPANVEAGRREGYVADEEGKLVRLQSLRGKRYEIERDPRGVQAGDVWPISFLHPSARERLGYPPQKPEALLERIIEAASNPGDLVLDPFCGCGTTIAVAQRLNRRWVGIDITHLATGLIKSRLADSFGPAISSSYRVVGEPTSVEDARVLAFEDPFQFEAWALGLVGARPEEIKRGADRGIDGRLYFHDDTGPDSRTKSVIISVKAGQPSVSHVRDLRGTVEREEGQIGVLLLMNPPTSPMRTEAADSGFYHSAGWNRDYSRIQLLTVEELLAGKQIDYPPGNVTLRKAPRAKPTADNLALFESGTHED